MKLRAWCNAMRARKHNDIMALERANQIKSVLQTLLALTFHTNHETDRRTDTLLVQQANSVPIASGYASAALLFGHFSAFKATSGSPVSAPKYTFFTSNAASILAAFLLICATREYIKEITGASDGLLA